MIQAQFVIQNAEKKYLYYDSQKHLCITERPEKASKFETQARAYHVLNCSYPKKKRQGWMVVELSPRENPKSTQKLHIDVPQVHEGFTGFNWAEFCSEIKCSYEKVEVYRKEVYNELSRVEVELCDCEHACEILRCDAAKGYKIYKMIHERRLRRRFLKNEIRRCEAVLRMTPAEIVSGAAEESFQYIDSRSYTPRVLKELFI